ncbi:MAG: transcription termination/antitermination protein NusG [Bryobacteraceae bacterium]
MTYSHSELAKVDTPLWFCLKAQTKREHMAAAVLQHQAGIPSWAPRLRFKKATSRGAVWFVEALFPGYFFAQFVYQQHRRLVEASSGVLYIVTFGEHVATIDSGTLRLLQQRAGADEVVTIEPEVSLGDSVMIAEGPFQGLEALVTKLLPAKERVRVLLEFLGRSVETEVAAARVLLAGGVRQGL